MNLFSFFTDPVLRAPMIGSILMCLAASLVGVCVFIRKRSLLGEALSHATYPGVTFAIVLSGIFSFEGELSYLILIGGFVSALAGYWTINFLQTKLKVSPDAALCAILALFFGVGVTIASFAQQAYPALYRQIQAFLYGQAATMTDAHIVIYALLVLGILSMIGLFYKEILVLSFDKLYGSSLGISMKLIERLIFLLTVLAIVIGIRSVGVILMSAMLIAPATAARQFTHRLSHLFFAAALFGILSGLLGTYTSVVLSRNYTFPTGPMIVLISGTLAILALFFAPERGLFIRYIRIARFRWLTVQENLLKNLWRLSQKQGGKTTLTFSEVAAFQPHSKWYLKALLYHVTRKGWLEKRENQFQLTPEGLKRGGRIVRLHRLWEVYLVHALGLNLECVHKSAEEMEHILTPELEKKLTELLDNPKHDPHKQPIPAHEEVMTHG